jgi:hypothetical protein
MTVNQAFKVNAKANTKFEFYTVDGIFDAIAA